MTHWIISLLSDNRNPSWPHSSAVWEGQRRRSCTPRRTSPNLPFSSPTTQSQKSRNTRTTPPKKNQFQTITSNDNQFQPITNNDKRYLMCVAAASVAEATTYPLDLCKTRGAFYNVKLFTNPKKTVFLRRPSLATLLVNHLYFPQASDPGRAVLWQRQWQSLQRDAKNHVWNCQRGGDCYFFAFQILLTDWYLMC